MLQDTCHSSMKDFLEKLSKEMKLRNLSLSDLQPGSVYAKQLTDILKSEYQMGERDINGYFKMLWLFKGFETDLETSKRDKHLSAVVRPYPNLE